MEDRYDLIVGSYLNTEKAKVECKRLSTNEFLRMLQAKTCAVCPLFTNFEKPSNDDIEFVKTFCAYYAPEKDDWCCNYTSELDESRFDVREVEVIE
nr:MAG TPA: hypothetical protein [Caudoviricetes sp.]